MADESYPDELRYHPEHDWVRIDGEEATFGITWYAQDSLGEVVFFDPPDVGGWPNNEAWISSNTVIARVNFVSEVLAQLQTVPHGTGAPSQVDTVLSRATANLLNKAKDDHARWFLTLASPEFQLK